MADFTTVKFIIAGLAFCRPIPNAGRGELQVLFLHPDNTHNLKLIIDRSDAGGASVPVFDEAFPDLGTALNRNKFQITADAMITSDMPFGSSNTLLVNLLKIHADTGNPVKIRNGSPIKRTFISIPSNKFYSVTPSKLNHEFWIYNKRANPHTKTLIPGSRRLIGIELNVDFKVPLGHELKLDLIHPSTKNFSMPTAADRTYTVKFDNTCHEHSCGNDFAYYYEILDGTDLEIEQYTVRSPISTGGVTLEAACNPAWGDPPPCNWELYWQTGQCS